MKNKYIIVTPDLKPFLTESNEIKYFDTKDDALNTCGIYELENVWIVKFIQHS
jgi:hypothetical protein